MIDIEAFSERVSIRMYCAGMTEEDAVRLTKAEQPKPKPEAIARLEELRLRASADKHTSRETIGRYA